MPLPFFRARRFQHNHTNPLAGQHGGGEQPDGTAADDHDGVVGDVPARIGRNCREVSHPMTVPRQVNRAPVQTDGP
ncbi:hypothetical protein MABM_46350 [Mycobacteroides abscessus]|nr:hypothetical protein MABM_46350 [Mycobacteroides abscessus]